jgi:hypothetical protein
MMRFDGFSMRCCNCTRVIDAEAGELFQIWVDQNNMVTFEHTGHIALDTLEQGHDEQGPIHYDRHGVRKFEPEFICSSMGNAPKIAYPKGY